MIAINELIGAFEKKLQTTHDEYRTVSLRHTKTKNPKDFAEEQYCKGQYHAYQEIVGKLMILKREQDEILAKR